MSEVTGKFVKTKKHIQEEMIAAKPKTVAAPSAEPKIKPAMLANKIAENTLGYLRNFKFKDAEKFFPHEPKLRTVERYFPNAIGGPLLVDEPDTERDVSECVRKAEVLKKLGYRYLVLKKNTDEIDARQALGA